MINRIILIGNGFDLAHGLATGYKDFIDKYWTDVSGHILSGFNRFTAKQCGSIKNPHPSPYEDELVLFEVFEDKQYKTKKTSYPNSCSCPYDDVKYFIAILNDSNTENYKGSVRLTFKNKFFEHISDQTSLTNWVDIENEYYGKLKELLAYDDKIIRNEKIMDLNRDLDAIKKQLESYLIQVVNDTKIKSFQSIREVFRSLIDTNDIALTKRKMFVDCTISSTLILNFNYTNTANLYIRKGSKYEINHIHGELNNEYNPIILGYGDELDEDYKRILNLNDNNYLSNIKSIRYLETENYINLLSFIDSAPFQIYIMGHSCGNSDRTLLNTLFEHKNCISIMPFYHQKDDGTDNYIEIIQNISRNFNDMRLMRDRVVNKTYCRPLVPRQAQKSKNKN